MVTKTVIQPTVPPAYLVEECPPNSTALLNNVGDIDDARLVAEKARDDCAAQIDGVRDWRTDTLKAAIVPKPSAALK